MMTVYPCGCDGSSSDTGGGWNPREGRALNPVVVVVVGGGGGGVGGSRGYRMGRPKKGEGGGLW